MPTVAQYDSSTPLLVVKVGRYPLHHGGLGAVRTVGRVGIPAFAMTEDRGTPVAWSRYLTGRTVAPLSGLEPAAQLVDRIRRAMERVGRPLIALPTDDEAAVLNAEHRDDLEPMLLAPPVTPSLPRKLANKSALSELCARDGVHTPRTALLRSFDQLDEFARTAPFPVVAKVVEPFRRLELPEFRYVTLVTSRQDLVRRFTPWPGSSCVMLQEYLPAETSQDWVFHGYFDASSECLVAFTAVKHRSWPPQFGMTTFATTVPNEALATEEIAFCRRVLYCGIVDMDWRLDQRDGTYRLLDCNPRVGAQFRLFENAAEIDVVRAMHLDLTGRPVPTAPMVDRTFVVEDLDFASRRSRVGATSSRHAEFAPSGRVERAWFATDDPVPVVFVAIHQLGPALKHARKRVLAALPRPRNRHLHGVTRPVDHAPSTGR